MVAENYRDVEERIQKACERSGRKASEVTLIAVSKTKPVQMIREAMEAGAEVFGENKVQELCEKYGELPGDLHWHMIGHLQRNKVKYVIDKAELIHSVDSLRLAEEISREAEKKGIQANILIEVNVAEEESKFGVRVEDTESLVRKTALLPNVCIKGLMTIAPYVENPEENRPVFRTLKKLAVDIKKKNIDNVSMDVLSMGMTGDYEVAVEEGATMVRVGTGIFGERKYAL